MKKIGRSTINFSPQKVHVTLGLLTQKQYYAAKRKIPDPCFQFQKFKTLESLVFRKLPVEVSITSGRVSRVLLVDLSNVNR